MATLKEYFDKDFTKTLSVSNSLQFNDNLGNRIQIPVRVHFDFDARVKFVSFFVASYAHALVVLQSVLDKIDLALAIGNGVEAIGGMVGEKPTSSKSFSFSGRVFFYSELPVDLSRLEAIAKSAEEEGVFVQFRGPEYASARSALEKPVAFICHDSRDKDAVARPIAVGLEKRMCWVWFDEYSLNAGDSLRESIEQGIKESKKCIVIISKHFISNYLSGTLRPA
jgi:hypothetical protein